MHPPVHAGERLHFFILPIEFQIKLVANQHLSQIEDSGSGTVSEIPSHMPQS